MKKLIFMILFSSLITNIYGQNPYQQAEPPTYQFKSTSTFSTGTTYHSNIYEVGVTSPTYRPISRKATSDGDPRPGTDLVDPFMNETPVGHPVLPLLIILMCYIGYNIFFRQNLKK